MLAADKIIDEGIQGLDQWRVSLLPAACTRRKDCQPSWWYQNWCGPGQHKEMQRITAA